MCPRHGSTTEKPAFSFPRGLLFTVIQITSCVYWKRPSLCKTSFLKQLVGYVWCWVLWLFFFSCRPIAHLVIAEHESVRICVTGPGHQNQFHQWIRTPYFREEISVAFVTIYLQQQTKKYGNEKTKQFFPLRVPWSSSLILTSSKNKLKREALHRGKDCSACLQTQPEVLPHLHVARLQRALGTESLP